VTRILVTGSRDWRDTNLLRAVLTGVADEARAKGDTNPVLVHGTARGADRQAERLWIELGLPVERHPADWETLGKAAGVIRNKAMVDTRPDLVVAFIFGGSPGATQCADYAEKKGLTVRRWTA
jgi:hypothetical protein